ncbi:hypothetical protein WN55_09252 [Dufourea novaeangliae]|uniref:Uncharacterized protein n=1 Tax=Dufourea novaeangliae TaxID=178035 RepID=A0A154PAU6_DUFNO|nr:hypothetical protein WN55_09252 [Dufourea novaeangliae]
MPDGGARPSIQRTTDRPRNKDQSELAHLHSPWISESQRPPRDRFCASQLQSSRWPRNLSHRSQLDCSGVLPIGGSETDRGIGHTDCSVKRGDLDDKVAKPRILKRRPRWEVLISIPLFLREGLCRMMDLLVMGRVILGERQVGGMEYIGATLLLGKSRVLQNWYFDSPLKLGDALRNHVQKLTKKKSKSFDCTFTDESHEIQHKGKNSTNKSTAYVTVDSSASRRNKKKSTETHQNGHEGESKLAQKDYESMTVPTDRGPIKRGRDLRVRKSANSGLIRCPRFHSGNKTKRTDKGEAEGGQQRAPKWQVFTDSQIRDPLRSRGNGGAIYPEASWFIRVGNPAGAFGGALAVLVSGTGFWFAAVGRGPIKMETNEVGRNEVLRTTECLEVTRPLDHPARSQNSRDYVINAASGSIEQEIGVST